MHAMQLKNRWFQDYVPGETFEFGDYLITEAEIIAFASRYDPQPFHVDAGAAAQSSFGGLVASGWMTGAVLMRMMCDHFISTVSAMGSPGVDQLRWLVPVRPGDRLHARVTVIDVCPSRSKPDRGTVTLRQEAINQDGDVVMSQEGKAIHRCRR
ncbi:MaoC family dehydratase [Rhodoferax ferrireducens]|uniref:MaoC family dehydratase n=1 Tax=Rhodoferax ferrireducens TaxID=192843 RepID=UPI000E0E08A4|nr:MaoC family dehydratase [Rhodoferax ferrireducens]